MGELRTQRTPLGGAQRQRFMLEKQIRQSTHWEFSWLVCGSCLENPHYYHY